MYRLGSINEQLYGYDVGYRDIELGRSVGGAPFIDDLAFDFNERETDSLIIKDAINSNNAEIVGGVVADFDGSSFIDVGNYSNTKVQDFDISFSVKHNNVGVREVYFANWWQSRTNNFSGFAIRKDANNKITIFIMKSLTTYTTVNSNSTLNAGEWYNIRVVKDGVNCKIYINGSLDKNVNLSTSIISYTTPSIPPKTTLAAHYSGGTTYFKLNGLMAAFQFDSWKAFNLNNNAINSIDGVEATWSGTEAYVNVTDYTPTSTLKALEEGYYQHNTTDAQVINPQYTLPTGWTAHDGGKLHNLIESYVDFDPTDAETAIFEIFNKASATVYNAACRSSVYYDSSNPYLWHTSELNYDTWNGYLNAAYKERNFTGIDTNYGTILNVFEILSYTTVKTGADLVKVLKYIKYNY